MAESPQSESSAFAFDGRCMRAIWLLRDGDGDPTRPVINRSMNNVEGHPTWKLYMRDIKVPILRGSIHEPPHYVYLDDQACYVVWSSKAYANNELHQFWPFDFDHKGNIRMSRKNRGRPAYTDDTRTQIATAPLGRMEKWYEFLGHSGHITSHTPLRPKTRTERETEEKSANEYLQRRSEADNTDGECTYLTTRSTTNIDRTVSGDHISKSAAPERKTTGPFLISSSDSSPTSTSSKRPKYDHPKGQTLGASGGARIGGMHASSSYATDMALGNLHDENNQLKYDFKNEREVVVQLKQENCALVMKNKALADEIGHLREVCIQLLVEKRGQQKDLDNRVIALHCLSNDIGNLSNRLKEVAISAAKDIAPTECLSEDIGCVLGRVEKLMYDRGKEELWRELQSEAKKSIGNESSIPLGSQDMPWSYC